GRYIHTYDLSRFEFAQCQSKVAGPRSDIYDSPGLHCFECPDRYSSPAFVDPHAQYPVEQIIPPGDPVKHRTYLLLLSVIASRERNDFCAIHICIFHDCDKGKSIPTNRLQNMK